MGFPVERVLKLAAIAAKTVGGPFGLIAAPLLDEIGNAVESDPTSKSDQKWDDKQEREWVKLAKKLRKNDKLTDQDRRETLDAQIIVDLMQAGEEPKESTIEALRGMAVSIAKSEE